MRSPNRSIRARLFSLLLAPLSLLVAVWVMAVGLALPPMLAQLHARTETQLLTLPAQTLVKALQAERRESALYLAAAQARGSASTGSRPASTGVLARPDNSALQNRRTETDAAINNLRAISANPPSGMSRMPRQRLLDLVAVADSLTAVRSGVDRGDLDRLGAVRSYGESIESAFLLQESVGPTGDDVLLRQWRGLIDLRRIEDVLSTEAAVVAAANVTGGVSQADQTRLGILIGAQRYLLQTVSVDLTPTAKQQLLTLLSSDDYSRLAAVENRIITAPRSAAADAATGWTPAYDASMTGLDGVVIKTTDEIAARTDTLIASSQIRLGLVGVAGLIATTLGGFISIRVARRLLARLAGLRQAALEMAVDRLPRAVARLRRGETVDVARETPALPYGEDEIGQVAHAFNELQRTAVGAAVEEANLRKGLNEVFLNIARRSQTLLHRQLSILDTMERRVEEPTELEDLFRLDHLATRMRRHAEDLVILAGSTPGRGWRNPVPIVDVLRGAVSEVEDYARVSIQPLPEIAIVGRAVGDLIHLLAELVENATSFSPPHTRVSISGAMVSHGFAIEIEDRGLGVAAELLSDLNSRLADPPDFDPANSARLGLFVVARLAQRLEVRTSLRNSPYGGITAVVLIPEELIVAMPGEFADRQRLQSALSNPTAERRAIEAAATAPLPRIKAPLLDSPPATAARGTPAARRRSTKANEPADTAELEIVKPQARRNGAPKPRHSRTDVIEATEVDDLPKRVRQSHLAPQLRNESLQTGGDIATQAPATRTPERMREMMSSFQDGLTRGRREADRDSDTGVPGRNAR